LSSDYDIAELLHLLVERCGELLGAATAGVLVETEEGTLQLAAALSEEMEAIEEDELAAGEGPCVEAYRTREPVIVHDLAEAQDRWPKVVPRLDVGMRAGHASRWCCATTASARSTSTGASSAGSMMTTSAWPRRSPTSPPSGSCSSAPSLPPRSAPISCSAPSTAG
jgi:hypothetical protein